MGEETAREYRKGLVITLSQLHFSCLCLHFSLIGLSALTVRAFLLMIVTLLFCNWHPFSELIFCNR